MWAPSFDTNWFQRLPEGVNVLVRMQISRGFLFPGRRIGIDFRAGNPIEAPGAAHSAHKNSRGRAWAEAENRAKASRWDSSENIIYYRPNSGDSFYWPLDVIHHQPKWRANYQRK